MLTNKLPELPVLILQPLSDAAAAARTSDGAELKKIQEIYINQAVRYNDQDIESLLKAQREKRYANDLLDVRDDAVNYALKASIEGIPNAATSRGPWAYALAKVLTDGAKKGLDFYFQKQKQMRDSLLATQFRRDLAEIPKSGNLPSADEIRKYYLQQGDGLLGSTLLSALQTEGFNPQEIAAIQEEHLARLIELSAKSETEIARLTDRQAVATDQFAKILSVQRQISSNLNTIAEQQTRLTSLGEELRVDVSRIKSKVELTEQKASVVHDILVAQLPASEQKKYLQSRIETLPAGEQKTALQALETRILLEERIPQTIGHVKEVGTIIRALGAPRDVLAKFDMAVGMASSLQQGALAFASGNYLGGVAAVMSLFGTSGDDIEEQRFAEVFKQLKEIRELQIKTLDLLYSIAEQLGKVVDQLDTLAENLAEVKDITREDLEADIGFKDCETIIASLESNEFTDDRGDFIGFDQRQRHFREFSSGIKADYFANCLHSLDLLFSATKLSSLFHQRAQPGAELLESKRYSTALDMLSNYIPTFKASKDEGERDERFNKLFALSIEPLPLNHVPKLISEIETRTLSYDRFLPNEKYALLAPSAIARYVEALLKFHTYPIFIEQVKGSSRISGSDFMLANPLDLARRGLTTEQKRTAKQCEQRLKQALRIINTSIAQQHLLSGSLTMIAVTNRLNDYKVPDSLLRAPRGDQNAVWTKSQEQAKYFNQNVEVIKFIARDQTFATNWVKFETLTGLYPNLWDQAKPFESTNYGSFSGGLFLGPRMREHPNFRAGKKSALLNVFAGQLCPDMVKSANTPRVPQPGFQSLGAFRVEARSIPGEHQYPQALVWVDYQKPAAEMLAGDGTSRVPLPLPGFAEIDPEDIDKNLQAQTPALKLLFQLKASLLEALMGYSGFEGFDDRHRQMLLQLFAKS